MKIMEIRGEEMKMENEIFQDENFFYFSAK